MIKRIKHWWVKMFCIHTYHIIFYRTVTIYDSYPPSRKIYFYNLRCNGCGKVITDIPHEKAIALENEAKDIEHYEGVE